MEDSGAILYQISCLKEMLDQVNEEIESNIEVSREIESEMVKCTEFEAALTTRESLLTKSLYISHFEIDGLLSVIADSRNSLKFLEEELSCLTTKRDEMLKRIDDKRDGFTKQCLEFQREIDKGDNNELVNLLSEKELLENEIHLLHKKNNALRNSMSAFVEEILEDLYSSNADFGFTLQARGSSTKFFTLSTISAFKYLNSNYDMYRLESVFEMFDFGLYNSHAKMA